MKEPIMVHLTLTICGCDDMQLVRREHQSRPLTCTGWWCLGILQTVFFFKISISICLCLSLKKDGMITHLLSLIFTLTTISSFLFKCPFSTLYRCLHRNCTLAGYFAAQTQGLVSPCSQEQQTSKEENQLSK